VTFDDGREIALSLPEVEGDHTSLRELLVEAWLERAPKRLAAAHEDELLGR
jgi:hypothetical protein